MRSARAVLSFCALRPVWLEGFVDNDCEMLARVSTSSKITGNLALNDQPFPPLSASRRSDACMSLSMTHA